MFLHLRVPWTTEIDGITEASLSKPAHPPKPWPHGHWSRRVLYVLWPQDGTMHAAKGAKSIRIKAQREKIKPLKLVHMLGKLTKANTCFC